MRKKRKKLTSEMVNDEVEEVSTKGGKTIKSHKRRDTTIYPRQTVVFNFNSGISHQIFNHLKPEYRVNESTKIGTRVLVARYPSFYKIYLYSFHYPGEPAFPRGGVKVWNATYGQMQYFYNESVAIHPAGGYHRFDRVREIVVDNTDGIGYLNSQKKK